MLSDFYLTKKALDSYLGSVEDSFISLIIYLSV